MEDAAAERVLSNQGTIEMPQKCVSGQSTTEAAMGEQQKIEDKATIEGSEPSAMREEAEATAASATGDACTEMHAVESIFSGGLQEEAGEVGATADGGGLKEDSKAAEASSARGMEMMPKSGQVRPQNRNLDF